MKKDIQLYKALHNKQQRKALNRIADGSGQRVPLVAHE